MPVSKEFGMASLKRMFVVTFPTGLYDSTDNAKVIRKVESETFWTANTEKATLIIGFLKKADL